MRLAALLAAAAIVFSRTSFADDPYELARWTSEQPQSIAMTSEGTVLVLGSDFGGGNGWVIREFTTSGQVLRTIPGATDCFGSFFGNDAKVVPAPQNGFYTYSPQCGNQSRLSHLDAQGTATWSVVLNGDNRFDDLTVDNQGNALVSNAVFSKIYKFDPTGAPAGIIDLYGPGWPTSNVSGIAVDPVGNIWAASSYSTSLLIKATADGEVLGSYPLPQLYGSIRDATGMCSNGSDRIYVGIQPNSGPPHVCEFDTTGTFLRAWGPWNGGAFGGGSFTGYVDVACSAAGDLLVTDEYDSRIHRFVDAGNPAPQVTANGVVNDGLGSALLQTTPGGQIVISNIGSSGNDGVSFPAPDADNGRAINFGGGLRIDPAVDAGASIVADITGSAAGGAASLGSIRVDVVSDGMDITPNLSDLGTNVIHVEAFDGDERTHSCEVTNGTLLHRSSPSAPALKGGNGTLAAGDGIEGVQVGLKKKPCGQLQSSITFTGSQTVNINGTPVTASKLQFTVLAPKQPVVAATTALRVARPGTVAHQASGPASTTADNFATVSIASQPPAVDVNGAAGGGLHVEPLGAAAFPGGTMDDGPTVTGIGSSGQDGVDLWLDASTGATHSFADGMGFDTATDAGAFLEHRVRGRVGCMPDSAVAVMTETVYPDSITLSPDFSRTGATGVTITISNNGTAVHTGTYPVGQTVRLVEPLSAGPSTRAASINTSRSNLKDKASIAARPSVSIGYKRPPGSSPQDGAAIHAMPFDLMIGSNRYQGDDVSFTAIGGTTVSEFTGASLRQRNPGVAHLSTLQLKRPGITAGTSDATNVSKGAGALLAVGGKIVVHNIGSSGNDGVSVAGKEPASSMAVRVTRVPPASALASGATMKMISRGVRPGSPDPVEVLAVQAAKVGSKLRLGAVAIGPEPLRVRPSELSGSTYRLEVLLNGGVVATQDGANPQADFDRLPDQLRDLASGPTFEGTWDMPLQIDVVGGPSVAGNGIRVRPLGTPNDVSSLSAMDLQAANIPAFEIGDWATPVTGVTPPASGRVVAHLAIGRNPVIGAGLLDLTLEAPAAAWVDLDLFDAQGRKSSSIFHGMLAPGVTTKSWRPARGIGSGIYFLRMASAGVVQSEKVAIIR